MDVEKQMEQDSASQVFASFAEPLKSFGEANLGVATNRDMQEDQLSRFMTRAMTLQPSTAPKVGSFVGYTARFNGDAHDVDNFILNITLYKDIEGIKDETALQELSLLLEGEAAIWWANMKKDVHIWSEALKLLQRKFSIKRQPYEVYHQIFSVKQDDHIPTEMFINQKRALFDELPQTHSEDVQIDMIYSLLKSKVRKKIPRETIVTFDQLICAARRVEYSGYKRRLRRFERYSFDSSISAEKPTKFCTHYREFDESERSREVDCYKFKSKRRRRVDRHREYILPTPNTSRTPLDDFNLTSYHL
ncbi:activity-regulated cytoskeleton associated protein 2-like [Bombus huntii]|uniref:activity-regulated cytoskeleton associated protein 2-like n=1 Tax=Bombus huntii TaxID=85661 RepID=UPI0021AADD16|nr:activity-regulated cytoskeleton associated protein 2-like [Bombus huntii]